MPQETRPEGQLIEQPIALAFDVESNSKQEAETQRERRERLSAKVEQLFPGEKLKGLRENIIERSFNVPQWGEYHNEGMFMDTHLDTILQNIQDIADGKFPETVPAEVRGWMQEVVQGNQNTLEKYTFLHDISKADCLTIKYADGHVEEPTWDEWAARLPEGVQGNPEALKQFCESNGISAVSYFQKDKDRKHGGVGADELRPLQDVMEVPGTLLTAIDKHEVAYQFGGVNVGTYEKHFGTLSEEEKRWAVTASYVDTMASLRKDGKPDLSNFLNMVNTMHNAELVKQVGLALQAYTETNTGVLDQRKVDQAVQALRGQKTVIAESLEAVFAKLQKECAWSVYDLGKLADNLEALVVSGQIPAETKQTLLECIDPSTGRLDEGKMSAVRKQLGKKNQVVTQALEAAKQLN